MSKFVTVVVVTTILLAGCSRAELPPVAAASTAPAATPASATPAKDNGEAAAVKLQEASKACKEETRQKGIKSILGIFSRLRPGSTEADYTACMKRRGFDA